MPDLTALRIGIIGCGGIAQMMHLPYLERLSDRFTIHALSDLSQQLLEALGDRYRVPADRQYHNYRDLLTSDVDAVLVLHSGNHAPQVLDAIHAGKHVFVEKPMCYTLQEADAIIRASEEQSVTVMVGYMKRYDPGYLYAQQFIQSMHGIQYVQINTLHPAESEYLNVHDILRFDDVPVSALQPIRAANDAQIIRAVGDVDPFLKGKYAGLFLGSMVHDTNALRGLLGEPEAVLFAEMWPNEAGEVSVTTVLRYPENVRVVYTWTFLEKLRDYFQEIAVMSSENRVRIQFPSPYLKNFPTPIVIQGMEGGAAYTKRVEVAYQEAFMQELIAYHDCIVHRRAPLTDAHDGRGDIALLQQIFAALRPVGLGGEAAIHLDEK